MMEQVACFERGQGRVCVCAMEVVEGAGYGAGIEQTIGGVEHPDGTEHRHDRDCGQVHAVGTRDKNRPKACNGRGVEREQVPAYQRTGVRRGFEADGLGGRGGHRSILGALAAMGRNRC